MVFLGRPSEACYPCRKGRLRCDRLQPGCTQCSRKRIACPGYRDLSEFYFRDETANTARKAQNQKPRKRPSAKTRPQRDVGEKQQQQQHSTVGHRGGGGAKDKANNASSRSSTSQSTGIAAHVAGPAAIVRYRGVSQPIEDLARTYFMVDYIASSPFGYLLQLSPRELDSENAMSAAIAAASHASLSLKLSDSRLMKQARWHYAKALYQTNKALSSAELAVHDTTLAAVLLLGLFEAIVFTGQQSMDSWNAHTLGTVELLRLRGTRQLQTPLGRKLFVHSSNNIRTSCAHTGTPVPPRFLELYEHVRPQLDPEDPFLRMAPLLDRVASFRSRVAQAQAKDDCRRHDLVVDALQLDADAARLGQNLPERWRFTARLPGESSPMTYNGVSLRYLSLRALRYWNALRIVRMLLNDLIWVQSSHILSRGLDIDLDLDLDLKRKINFAEVQRSAASNLSSLVIEVLASCGEYLEPSHERFSISARCLIWPLSVVADVALTPADSRQFALDCLDRLRQDCRVPHHPGVATGATGTQGGPTGMYHHLL